MPNHRTRADREAFDTKIPCSMHLFKRIDWVCYGIIIKVYSFSFSLFVIKNFVKRTFALASGKLVTSVEGSRRSGGGKVARYAARSYQYHLRSATTTTTIGARIGKSLPRGQVARGRVGDVSAPPHGLHRAFVIGGHRSIYQNKSQDLHQAKYLFIRR